MQKFNPKRVRWHHNIFSAGCVCGKGEKKKDNFTVEKPNKYYFSQVQDQQQ